MAKKKTIVDWRPVREAGLDRPMLFGAVISPLWAFFYWVTFGAEGQSLLNGLSFVASILFLTPFVIMILIWVHELGHAAGMRLRGLPILDFYAPGLGWCGGAPVGHRARLVWVGLFMDGAVRTGVREDTPDARRSLGIGVLAGPLGSIVGGLLMAGAAALLSPMLSHPFAHPLRLIVWLIGPLSVLIGIMNLWPSRFLGIASSDGMMAKQLMGGEAANLMLLFRASLASAEGRLAGLTEELDAAADSATDPMMRLQMAVQAQAASPSIERQAKCWGSLEDLPAKAKPSLAANLHFALWEPGQPIPSAAELGLPNRPNVRQIMHMAPFMILHAHLQGSVDVRSDVTKLGRWSRSAASSFGWRWLLANERRWRSIDPALGDAFRSGAKIPDGEALS